MQRAQYPSRKASRHIPPPKGIPRLLVQSACKELRSLLRSKMKASLNSIVENMGSDCPKVHITIRLSSRLTVRNTSRWPTYRHMILIIILSFMRSFHHQLVLWEWHIFDGIQRGRKIWILYYLSIMMIIILIY